jgi:hypothetical protein
MHCPILTTAMTTPASGLVFVIFVMLYHGMSSSMMYLEYLYRAQRSTRYRYTCFFAESRDIVWRKIAFLSVFRIRDILVRIRIRGSVPRTFGSGSGSCSFRQEPTRCQKLLFEGTGTLFNGKSRKEVLLFLLDDRRIRIRIRILTSD